MRHGYLDSTERVQLGVRKSDAGPDARACADAESVALTRLAGLVPVPAVLDRDADGSIVTEFRRAPRPVRARARRAGRAGRPGCGRGLTSEFGTELAAAADAVFTDSVAQVAAYHPPNVLVGTPYEHGLTSLGAVVAGDAPGRAGDEQSMLSCSVGLAGTESYLLDRLLC